MAKLNTNEKQILEKVFRMGGGYVLNFTDRTMEEFFNDDLGVSIYDGKYNYASGSKANRMRGFWQTTDDRLVGKSIIKLTEYIENQILLDNLERGDFPQNLVNEAEKIGNRLLGSHIHHNDFEEADEFLKQDYKQISIDSLGLSESITKVLQQRFDEIKACLSKAPLAAIFLCGSTLEGILLGIATNNPQKFNAAKASPKIGENGQVKKFQEWTLSDLINVARETGFIREDVKKFSHSLREFRNYIHPYEQAIQNFSPDEHTTKICWQVLMAAISQISEAKR